MQNASSLAHNRREFFVTVAEKCRGSAAGLNSPSRAHDEIDASTIAASVQALQGHACVHCHCIPFDLDVNDGHAVITAVYASAVIMQSRDLTARNQSCSSPLNTALTSGLQLISVPPL